MASYLFTSDRLGFRSWKKDDLDALAAMNSDPRVMEFFPNTQSREQSLDFLERQEREYANHGYCFFLTELLTTSQFIGFIGLQVIPFEAHFTPGVEIGWRILPQFWSNGYASEGANRCLKLASEEFSIQRIYSFAPVINRRSISVMERIGMQSIGTFAHPRLIDSPQLQPCALYQIDL